MRDASMVFEREANELAGKKLNFKLLTKSNILLKGGEKQREKLLHLDEELVHFDRN